MMIARTGCCSAKSSTHILSQIASISESVVTLIITSVCTCVLSFFFSDSCRAFRIRIIFNLDTKIFTCTIVQSWSGPSVNRIFRPACNCDMAWPYSVILAEVGRATCITISRVLNSGSFKTGSLMFLLCNRPWIE